MEFAQSLETKPNLFSSSFEFGPKGDVGIPMTRLWPPVWVRPGSGSRLYYLSVSLEMPIVLNDQSG